MRHAVLGCLFALAAVSAGRAAEPGQLVFESQCSACHALDPDEIKNGPTLKGVVGRKSGTIDGFDYSDAMASAGLTWTAPTLDVYLKDPQAKVPGTKMLYPGLADAKDRSDLIAYLSTQH